MHTCLTVTRRRPTFVVAIGFLAALAIGSNAENPVSAASPFAEKQGQGLTQFDALTARHAFGLSDAPTGQIVDNEWNLPLTSDEAARIRFATYTVQEREERDLAPIVRGDPGYAGAEIDWSSDQVVVWIKGDASRSAKAAAALDLGWPVTFKSARYTADELAAVQAAIDATYGSRGELIKTGHDVSSNNIEVVTRTQAVADEINTKFRYQVNAHVGALIENMDGTAANCGNRYDCDPPVRGGSLIKRGPTEVPCTAGFVMQNASTADGVSRGAMITTAGHCYRSGYTAWHSANGSVGTSYDHYGDAGGTTINADVMLINIADAEDSNDVIDHAQPGNDYVMDITSTGCAVELSSTCGEIPGQTRIVSTGNSDIKYSTTLHQVNITVYGDPMTGSGVVTKRHSRELNGNPFTGGDSGSPVVTANKAHGVFFGGGGGYSYYSHILYVTMYCSHGTTCAVKTTN